MSEHSCPSSGGGDRNMDQALREMQIKQRLGLIRNKIVVLSGKGGVGKSTVAASVALKLAMEGYKVGLMDVDIHGPSQPRMFGVKDRRPGVTAEENMVPVDINENLKLISIGLLLPSDKDALIWRGPMKIGVIQQFIADVEWGELDFLVVDCPPGTGDEPLSVVQMIPDARGILVTTPQGMAVEDVHKSITFCRKLNMDLLGIVENMSGMTCPHCGELVDVFPGNGGETMAAEAGLPLLGRIPINPKILLAGDEGKLTTVFKEMTAFDSVVAPLLDLANGETVPGREPDGSPQERIQTIAVPVDADGTLSAHFGHASTFTFFIVDTHKQTIVEKKDLTPPDHQPGVIPRWVAAQGAHVMLAGGMGEKAKSALASLGVHVVDGVMDNGMDADALIRHYMDGILIQGGPGCSHDHGHDHGGGCGSGGGCGND